MKAASNLHVWRKPYYYAQERGISWSVIEKDAQHNHEVAILHNLLEWQAKAIASILRDSEFSV